MPQPPITIGELTDVPAFDSPIASPWAQEVTRRSVHRFASTAERDSKYPAASAGTGAVCDVVGVPYWSDGARWQGPLGAGADLIGSPPSGAGGYTSIIWGAGSYAGGLITVNAAGDITLAAGISAGVWLVTWQVAGQAPAAGTVETRVLCYPTAGGVIVAIQPMGISGTSSLGGTCHFRVPAGGAFFQVQTVHPSSRTLTGGMWRVDRVSF